MTWKRTSLIAGAACALAGLAWAGARSRPAPLALSGLVTTDEVVVAPAVAGRLTELLVREGDAVARGQPLATLEPAELAADRDYYARGAEVLASAVEERQAALRAQERETSARVRQASATLGAAREERAGAAAQLEEARAAAARQEALARAGAASDQERDRARRDATAAQARLDGLDRQIEARGAALELARAGAEQSAVQRAALAAARHQRSAAEAQRDKAELRLGYARLTAPVAGLVDVRAARLGEFVAVGQPVFTLVDPDALWIRADVEESAIGRIRLGDRLEVRLASGEVRQGTVFFRGVDAGFATQRDVGGSRRDVRAFEVRLRVDNRDRRLALGSTAQVLLPEAE